MDDLIAAGAYFQRKAGDWASTDGSVAVHLRRLGRSGLIAEFRSDPDFEVVGRYLHRLSDVQYVHDANYTEFRAQVRESVFGRASSIRGVPRQTDSIVRAAMMACGIVPFADRLVRIAGNLPRA
jgi:hypothetical protein